MSKFRGVKHPSVFEVNTRLLLGKLSSGDKKATLADIPDDYWEDLASKGIHYVWLMGVWSIREVEINPDTIDEEMRTTFTHILHDLSDNDIGGSPYAIDDYTVDEKIGGEQELRDLREKLGDLGMGLILDFIPNHFGANTHWLHTHPEYFIEVGEAAWNIDQKTFYTPLNTRDKYFAHGKDPYFEAWQDTIQLDYAFDGTHDFMTEQLTRIAALCDGVRCDMAMLPVKRIFEKTWSSYVQWRGEEFWPAAVSAIKSTYPGFVFIAECYWDMEAELLDMGIDYAYDKTFYDRMTDPPSLDAHFKADMWYLERTVRFLENHDEERIAGRFTLQKHMAAAALLAFSPGMKLWHMGQWDGVRTKIPVQLTRMPDESCGCFRWVQRDQPFCTCINEFYGNLLDTVNDALFQEGQWRRLDIFNENASLFCWKWSDDQSTRVVIVNFGDSEVKVDLSLVEEAAGTELAPFHPDAPSQNSITFYPWDVRLWKDKA